MKKFFAVITMIAGLSQVALADSGPQVTVLKSVEYIGKIVGQTKSQGDQVCKLVISLNVFTNDINPNGPIKNEYVDFRLYTANDITALNNLAVWEAEVIDRTNAQNSNSDVSALPMNLGTQGKSSYNGQTLYQSKKLGDGLYSGKTEMWINNVSPNAFDRKPSEVRVLTKGGTLFATKTEADYSCQF